MNTTTKKAARGSALTSSDLDRMANEDEFLGFGYIGGRRSFSPETREVMDALVLDCAARLNLTYGELFEWANSKAGRWFADCCDRPSFARGYLPRLRSIR